VRVRQRIEEHRFHHGINTTAVAATLTAMDSSAVAASNGVRRKRRNPKRISRSKSILRSNRVHVQPMRLQAGR
jgi:hypothetical protein